MAKVKPVIVPYNAKKHKGRNKYIAFCGECGNPIEKATAKKHCPYCMAKLNWEDTPYYTRFTLTDNAIKYGQKNL